jgi:hypothetical protein
MPTLTRRKIMTREIELGKTLRGEYRLRKGGHCFYLGFEQLPALTLATAIVKKFESLGNRWTPEVIQEMLQLKAVILGGGMPTPVLMPAPVPIMPAAPTPVPATSSLTLHGLVARFEAEAKARVPAEITMTHYLCQKYRLGNLKRHIPDCLLSTIDAVWIKSKVRYYCGRPHITARPRNWRMKKPDQGKPTKPMAVATVRGQITILRSILAYADDAGLWDAPKGFSKLFRFNQKGIMTPEEKASIGEFNLYSMEELTTLYKKADQERRGWILCGLNFAFANAELEGLLVKECKLDQDPPIVERIRNKTGVRGSWLCWPETTTILKAQCKGKKGTDRVFTRTNGQPLISLRPGAKSDRVIAIWRCLNRIAGVENRGFKMLRKLSAQMVRNVAGKDASERHLSHSDHSDISAHYTREEGAGGHFAGLLSVRQKLQPMFDAVPKPEASSVGSETPSEPIGVAA